jgi:DNA-binding beta-propeller fold protein YncE
MTPKAGGVSRLILLGLAGVLLSSCATPPKKESVPLRWPEPPLTTRIEFLKSLTSERDLGRKPTWREAFMEFLTGAKPPGWRLSEPMDVVVSDDGNRVYVSDIGQLQVFLFDLENRRVRLMGPFDRPFGLALDGQENLYIVEQASASISVLDRGGKKIRTIRHETLVRPTDIALDRKRSRLYVTDPARRESKDHTVKIFDLDGDLMGQVGREKGLEPGRLYFPTYVALDRDGNLFVTSTMSARVDVFSPEGRYLKTIGERGNAFGMFDKPKGVAVDSFDHLYVVDSGWSNVQIFDTEGRVLLFFGGRGGHPGLLKNPTGISIDRSNRIYVADLLNYRVSVYRLINPSDASEHKEGLK